MTPKQTVHAAAMLAAMRLQRDIFGLSTVARLSESNAAATAIQMRADIAVLTEFVEQLEKEGQA